jgi:hypothetical protein
VGNTISLENRVGPALEALEIEVLGIEEIFTFCDTNFIRMTFDRVAKEALLKGKAQYGLPPSTN